jgi:type IVB pilus formation R64 PilN family outer membrane protein
MKMRTNKIINLALSMAAIGVVAACSLSTDLDPTLEREVEKTVALREEAKAPMPATNTDVIRVKDDIWLGDTSEIEYEGEPVPSYLETDDGITLISNRPITLYEIGSMINKITSLSVRYDQELEQSVQQLADSNEPSLDSIGAQWTDSTKMLVSYKGPLSGLLDEISNRFGIWWKYEKKQIYFYKYITKSFVLYSLPTTPTLSVSVGGSSTEGSAGSSSVSLSNSVSINLWDNITTAIQSMISQGSTLTTDQSNGTITLTGTPTDIRKVAKFVNEQNIRLSRQVAISVKVLQVTISDSDQYGLNLSAAFSKDSGTVRSLGIANALSAGGDVANNLTMNIIKGDWSVDAAVQALSTQGTTNLVTSGTVTTLNNKPAPIQVVKTQNYISEITKTNSGSDGSYYDLSTETEEIETGFTLDVLPRILEHGRLMLLFNLTLSELLELQRVDLDNGGESGGQYIQNPIIETRGFTQEVAMTSGETLVLSGYERVENSTSKSGIGSADQSLLGGAVDASKARSILVIMLTPIVMESPLSPESRIKP